MGQAIRGDPDSFAYYYYSSADADDEVSGPPEEVSDFLRQTRR